MKQLPEKWFIRFNNKEQSVVIIEYFAKLYPNGGYEGFTFTGSDRAFNSCGGYCNSKGFEEEGYEEISFKDFEELVLNLSTQQEPLIFN